MSDPLQILTVFTTTQLDDEAQRRAELKEFEKRKRELDDWENTRSKTI